MAIWSATVAFLGEGRLGYTGRRPRERPVGRSHVIVAGAARGGGSDRGRVSLITVLSRVTGRSTGCARDYTVGRRGRSTQAVV